ncbi:MAG: type II toxin-antitoxin system RelE/ParE family toxin [bacterium]
MDDIAPVTVLYYQTNSGRCPFRDWLDSMGTGTQKMVDIRLTRVRRGLFGDSEYLRNGVHELKFDVGPGYRIYYGKDGKTVVILLYAGHKKHQSADIDAAISFWKDYLRRTRK